MEQWNRNNRTMNNGTMGQWNNGTMELEQWNNVTIEQWNNGTGTMEQWNNGTMK